MTIWDDTTKEFLTMTTIKMIGHLTHTSIEKTRNELVKIISSIRTSHTAFPKITKFRYAAAIMTAREYQKRVTSLGPDWTFTNPTNSTAYDLIIKN